MRKKIVYLFIFIAIAIFQLSFLPVVSGKSLAIDAVLMAILAWSVIDGFFAFLSWTIFFGIVYDLLSYSIVGTYALIFLLVLYFVSFFSRRFSMEPHGMGIILFLLFILVATLASNAILAVISAWHSQTFNGFWQSFGSFESTVIGLIFNTFLFFIFFFLIRRIKYFFAITN
ncbi:MAG: hypothetical protein ACD_5C00194G0003 [uncultured bacterium]|nr:MAG: hypothetical protein ACD_5C00194G0003 [uncultured bacterium]